MRAAHRRIVATGPPYLRSTSIMTQTHQTRHATQQVPQGAAMLFDTWLQVSLQRRYDSALSDTVPEQLLELLPD